MQFPILKQLKPLFLAITLYSLTVAPVHAMSPLTEETMNDAIRYGLENRGQDLNVFLGSNWREGANGSLLNIYTPFMNIARDVAGHKLPTDATPDNIAVARKTVHRDIDYFYSHPTVNFMVSLLGNTSDFASNYYARIEGVGYGRHFTFYPTESIPQYKATRDPNTTPGAEPYTAVNAYHFKYEDIAPLDEYTLVLYGKKIEPIRFKIQNKYIQ